ncbi:MAG: hypothetical protein ACREOU_11450 [Candidatus Eiseniibacteriota bacterium]
MKRMFFLAALIMTALVFVPVAGADVPSTMSYQGVLTDDVGNLVPDGTYDLTFSIFDVSVAGAALYTETHPAVLVTKGGFSVIIGEITPITLPFDVQYWLEVQVNLDPPLVPRVKLASSPYGLSLRLPFVGTTGVANPDAGIAITNTGTGRALSGTSNSTLPNAAAIHGVISSTAPGGFSAAVRGLNAGTGGNGIGVFGSQAGTGWGVYGTTPTGVGVLGEAGAGQGVFGLTSTGIGVRAAATGAGVGIQSVTNDGNALNATTTGGIGVNALSGTDKAVFGQTNSTLGNAYAIHGLVSSTTPGGSSAGVRGENNGTGGSGIGVYGSQDGTGWGVRGTTPGGLGVYGSGGTGTGVRGDASSGDGVVGASSTGIGVVGTTASTAGSAFAIHGIVTSTSPGGFSTAVRGQNNGTGGTGIGVWGSQNGTGWGVYGTVGGAGLAGNFVGNVNVSGTLTKGAGAFKIDHPVDPENKYLYHSFVESPDMKNIYDGVAILDANGEVTVRMPDWFEALNRDFRYQLTAVGAPAPGLHIAEKLEGSRFTIAGGTPGLEVSWQVTGIRQDATANAHRIPTEEAKAVADRGLYLDPQAFGQPKEKGIAYAQQRRMLEQAPVPAVEPTAMATSGRR